MKPKLMQRSNPQIGVSMSLVATDPLSRRPVWNLMDTATRQERVLLATKDEYGNHHIYDAHYSDGSPDPDAAFPAHPAGWYYGDGSRTWQPVPGKPYAWMKHPGYPELEKKSVPNLHPSIKPFEFDASSPLAKADYAGIEAKLAAELADKKD